MLDVIAGVAIWTFFLLAWLRRFSPKFGFLSAAGSILLVALAQAASLQDVADALGVIAIALLGCSLVYALIEFTVASRASGARVAVPTARESDGRRN